MAVRKTEALERQWRNQREQMLEERTHDQSGRPRSPEDIAIVDHDIAVMDFLINLTMGAKFDSRQVDRLVRDMRSL